MSTIAAAERYDPADELVLLTTYFNSHGYRTKRWNYDRFRERMEGSGLRLVTVECAFGSEPFELPADRNVRRVRGRDLMWQKERLLNLAISELPKSVRKIAWLDGDILFERADWAVRTAKLLDEFPVVQLFDRAIRLPRGHMAYTGEGDAWASFAAVYRRQPQQLLAGDFAAHGHTGFAWAARRDWLDAHGLYDACIAGSGDHMIAHAVCGDWTSPCIRRIIGDNNRHRDYFAAWAKRQYRDVRAALGCVPGTVLHLWHGDIENRRYVLRNRELAEFGFDPAADVRVGGSGCWEWSSRKPALHRWAREYFGHRNEDGNPDT